MGQYLSNLNGQEDLAAAAEAGNIEEIDRLVAAGRNVRAICVWVRKMLFDGFGEVFYR